MFGRFMNLNLSAYVIEGVTPKGGHPIKMLVAGVGAFRQHVNKIVCGSTGVERSIGKIPVWRIESVASKQDCDLILLTANAFGSRLGWYSDFFCLPQWIFGEVALDEADIYVGQTYHRRRDIRIVGENKLTYSVTTDRDILTRWYEDMYVPLIRASHGSAALLMNFDDMMARVGRRECELVLIADPDMPLGGSLIVYDNGRPRILARGILDANRDYQRKGVGAAIYLFSFDHLYKQGYKSVDIGRVRPFLGDGGLHFKKKNGLRLAGHAGKGFLITACRSSSGATEFFTENPFVHISDGGLRGVVILTENSSQTEKQIRKWVHYHELRGLDVLDVIRFPETTTINKSSVDRATRVAF